MTSGVPSVRTKSSSICSTSSMVKLKPGRASENTVGIHVADAVHLDDAEACMLLVVGAEAAVVGTAVVDFGAVGQRNGARFVVFAECRVGLRVGVNKCLDGPHCGQRLRM